MDNTKAIAVRDETDLTALLENIPTDVDGAEELGREDLSIPRLELVQAQSDVPDAIKHLGEWFNTLTGEFKPIVRIVPLGVTMGRAAFEREFSRDSQPLCASDDGKAPRAEYHGKMVTDSKTGLTVEIDGDCASCPLSQFTDNAPPLCAKGYVYAAIDVDNGFPLVLRLQRTGTATAKNINLVIKMSGRRFLVVLTSQFHRSDKGQYYEPLFTLGEKTPATMLSTAAMISRELGNIAKRVRPDVRPDTAGNGNTPTQLSDEDLPF